MKGEISLAKIKSPNPNYNGVSASLRFVNGEAETNDKWLIEWFKNKGYEVIGELKQDESKEKDLNQLNKDEITEKLTELGIEFDKNAKKADLLEMLKNAVEEEEGQD